MSLGLAATPPNLGESTSAAPLVSVIMPVYNKGATLEESVASVVAQTLCQWEIIVWDDGSPDDLTPLALSRIERRNDPRIQVVRASNSGVIAARNAAIGRSIGRYLCCLDPDDIVEPTYFEKAVMMLEARPELSVISPFVRVFGDDNLVWQTEGLVPKLLAYDNALPVCSIVRRDALIEVGGFSHQFMENCEDWALWAALAAAGHQSAVLPEVLFRYRYSHTQGRDAGSRNYDDFQRRISQLYPGLAGGDVPARVPPDEPPAILQVAIPTSHRRPVLLAVPWMTRLGGGEQVARVLAAGFRERGHTVVIVAFEPPPPDAVDGTEAVGSVTPYFYNLPTIAARDDFAPIVRRLMQGLPGAHIVIIGATWMYEHLSDVKSWCNGPVSVIDLLFNHQGHIASNVAHRSEIDAIVPVSHRLADLLVDHFNVTAKVKPIYIGIDPPDKISVVPPNLSRREELPLCVWLGRHSTEKRPEWFVDAARILQEFADFAMTGDDGGHFDPSGTLQRLGHLEDPSGLVSAADLLVLTSSIEGIPLTVMEAVAVGTPAFCTNVGGVGEFVVDGVNGVLVDPWSFDEFVASLRELLTDRPRLDRLNVSAAATGLPHQFSTEAMIDDFDELLADLEVGPSEISPINSSSPQQ